MLYKHSNPRANATSMFCNISLNNNTYVYVVVGGGGGGGDLPGIT